MTFLFPLLAMLNHTATSITSKDCILEDKHIWIKARDITVQPGIESVAGMNGFYMPPLAAGRTRIAVTFDGQTIKPDKYEWQLGQFIRTATHNGIKIQSTLVPITGKGIGEKLVLTNNTTEAKTTRLKISPDIHIADLRSGNWGWCPPMDGERTEAQQHDNALIYQGTHHQIAVLASGIKPKNTDFEQEIHLAANQSHTLILSLTIDSDQHLTEFDLENANQQTINDYENLRKAFPTFKSSNPELDAFYEKGLISYFTCIWESPAFALKKHIAESGIDGGAVCNYPWGIAYIAQILSLGDPKPMRDHILQALKADLVNHYAYTPLNGDSVGPWYAYNQYAIICTTYYYVLHTGDTALLNEKVNGKTVYELLLGHAIHKDDQTKSIELIDYGVNDNLLELKRTDDYQHFVPSPNAERYWNMLAVEQLATLAGVEKPNLEKRREDLKHLIQTKLWGQEHGWLGSIGIDGKLRPSYSIQVFDTLRFDILTKEQQDQIVAKLDDEHFLGPFGVHSLSKKDPGYDPNDVDWGGPGVYAGDGPELVQDLYHAGYYEQGDQLLKSLLWWGKHLPYYPQAICAGTLDYRHDGRANIVAGLKANELLVFGLLGLEIHPDRSVTIKPHLPSDLSHCEISNIKINEHVIGFLLEPKGVQYTVDHKTSNWLPLHERHKLEF